VKRKTIIIVFLSLLIGVAVLVYVGQWKSKRGESYYSGTIEATQSNLAFQTGGRVVAVPAREGQRVVRGTVLAELDRQEFRSRLDQAQAGLERAVKGKEQAEALLAVYRQTLPAEVERAEASVRALHSQLAELRAGTRPQDLERARQAMLAAKATLEDAAKNRDKYENLFRKSVVSEREADAVRLRYETALREFERSREGYELAQEGSRKETIRTAQARVEEGEALVRQARSNLRKIEAAQKDAEAAVSQVKLAQASMEQAKIQFDYGQLKAPFTGIITSRNIEPGEVVTPGREVLTLADLSSVDLKIFVEETRIGRVKPGQEAEVRVDTFPKKVFKGQVAFVSPEGEFTPKIIQTHKERVKLVFLVKVTVPNPDLELKPGMPADAWLKD
jgi:HlyD family secretion protein